MKLSNIITKNGKLTYRRRIRVDAKQLIPKTFFQTPLREQERGASLVSEHAALEAAFERLHLDALAGEPEALGQGAVERYVAKAYERLNDPRTQNEKWEDLKAEAERLVRSVHIGAASEMHGDGGDQARREIVADELERANADPLLYRAVVQPDAEAPPVTLADAAKVYAEEVLGPKPKKSANDTYKRVLKRLEVSLGPLDLLPLVDLKRHHARKLRDDLLAEPKNGGGKRKPSSVQREINAVKSIINTGIREFDLRGIAQNPFESLSVDGASNERGKAQSEWELRDPFPLDMLVNVRKRVLTRTRRNDLRLIWRLLQATGCRGAEITGLLTEDVVLDHKFPHIWVRWNDERTIKTKTSIRPVPLIGDGLVAAKEAIEAAGDNKALFANYAHENGPDGVSGALMNHIRNETDNPRHVVYSLRHNMKAWLTMAEVSERDENRILGHAEAAVGNRYYGGLEERLASTSRAIEKALSIAPSEAWEV